MISTDKKLLLVGMLAGSVIAGGFNNQAGPVDVVSPVVGTFNAVGGGRNNLADGGFATIPGVNARETTTTAEIRSAAGPENLVSPSWLLVRSARRAARL